MHNSLDEIFSGAACYDLSDGLLTSVPAVQTDALLIRTQHEQLETARDSISAYSSGPRLCALAPQLLAVEVSNCSHHAIDIFQTERANIDEAFILETLLFSDPKDCRNWRYAATRELDQHERPDRSKKPCYPFTRAPQAQPARHCGASTGVCMRRYRMCLSMPRRNKLSEAGSMNRHGCQKFRTRTLLQLPELYFKTCHA